MLYKWSLRSRGSFLSWKTDPNLSEMSKVRVISSENYKMMNHRSAIPGFKINYQRKSNWNYLHIHTIKGNVWLAPLLPLALAKSDVWVKLWSSSSLRGISNSSLVMVNHYIAILYGCCTCRLSWLLEQLFACSSHTCLSQRCETPELSFKL